ncbi:DUF2867 domain-containing protein [soil metagenome]
MTDSKVSAIPIPLAARANCGLADVNFADAYCGQTSGGLRSGAHPSAEQAGRAIFENPPRIAVLLMALRGFVVKRFGLKTERELGAVPEQGRIGIFPIVSVAERELVIGLDDKHLDFRIWISVQESSSDARITMTTLIHFNNVFGKLYLFTILPFHILLTRMMLKRALVRLGRS